MTNFDDISDNAAGFASSLMALATHVDGSIEKVIRKACIDLYRRIVTRTPVDTGRAKASWALDTYHANDIQSDPEGYSFNEVAQIIESNVSEFEFSVHDDMVIIYNNLEYIEGLENGTSKQAPNGMVAISLVEFTAHFNEHIKNIEGLGQI